MARRNETFGRLLRGAINSIAAYEGKTAPAVEEELGAQVGLAGSAIQRYKAGHIPPELATIVCFASAGVQRGFLNRTWLLRFLQAAAYPDAEHLASRLLPQDGPLPRPERLYHNLPAPTYSQFVMRPGPYAEVVEGLQKRSAAVLIIGLGGTGKTSLAREIAGVCLAGTSAAPQCDAVVWVSDKHEPGSTTFASLLDEIARTLDYPGYTQFEHEQKRREVEQLLRRQRVLVVVDNLETIRDSGLVAWLLDLPEPSKALITTRAYQRAFRRGGWPVELRGMQSSEAIALVHERLRRLRIDQLLVGPAQIDALISATGGNPKALELTLGLLKYERRSLPQVLADLQAARGDLFADLFSHAWGLLGQPARHVLMVATFFPASMAEQSLASSAGLAAPAIEPALEQLIDLALLDVEQSDLSQPARYSLHPLVRAFAQARLHENPEWEQASRERWLSWFYSLSTHASQNWYDVTRLAVIDNEPANLQAAIDWAMDEQRDQVVLHLSATLGYYYYVRGWWNEQLLVNTVRLRAARRMQNRVETGFTLTNMLRIFTLQERLEEAQPYAAEIQTILAQQALTNSQRSSLLHGLALYAIAQNQFEAGRSMLHEILSLSANPYKSVRATNWLAHTYLQEHNTALAEPMLQQALSQAASLPYPRAITFCQVRLAQLQLERGQLEQALQLLEACLQRSLASQDRRDLALIKQRLAQIYTMHGDEDAAQQARNEASDLFQRLGIRP